MTRVALITGTSTGIGRASALALARRGWQVWATMRDLERAQELQHVARAERLPLRALRLDVTSDESVSEALATALHTSGRIDALVANAGFHAGAALEDTSLETFRALLETNYLGIVRCIQAVLPHMREQRSGCIVGVTSQSGRFVHPTNAAYSGSKFAAEAALEALALEVAGFGVRVRIVEPGLTFTAAQEKAVPWPTPSEYERTYRRARAVFTRDARDGSSAEKVGETVAEAVESEEPRLRWLVGVDALRNLEARSRIRDEDWVSLHAEPDDAAFFARWHSHFGTRPDAPEEDEES